MANLTFRQPFWEIWQCAFPGLPYPKDYAEYLKARREDRVFEWCGCSEVVFGGFDPPYGSVFLNTLAKDLKKVECNAVLKKFAYIRLPKPIDAYEWDDYVQRCINHLANPGEQTIFQFIETLGLSLPFQYLLLNYLDNAGHMDHGTSLRVGCQHQDNSIPGCIAATDAPAVPQSPRPTSP